MEEKEQTGVALVEHHITEPEALPSTKELATAQELVITDDPSYQFAGELARAIKVEKSKVNARWKEPVADANKLHKSLTGKRKLELEPLDRAEGVVKEKIGEFREKREAVAKRIAEIEAKKERDRVVREQKLIDDKREAEEAIARAEADKLEAEARAIEAERQAAIEKAEAEAEKAAAEARALEAAGQAEEAAARAKEERIAAEARAVVAEKMAAESKRLELEAKARIEEQANAPIEEVAPAAPTAPLELPKTEGISTRSKWTATVTGRKAFLQGILDEHTPFEAVTPNQSFLNKTAQEFKGDITWPGVTIKEDKTITVR